MDFHFKKSFYLTIYHFEAVKLKKKKIKKIYSFFFLDSSFSSPIKYLNMPSCLYHGHSILSFRFLRQKPRDNLNFDKDWLQNKIL